MVSELLWTLLSLMFKIQLLKIQLLKEVLGAANVEYTITADRVETDAVLEINIEITLAEIDPLGLLSDFFFEACPASNMAVDDGSGLYWY